MNKCLGSLAFANAKRGALRGPVHGLMVSVLVSGSSGLGLSPGACFSKAPESFRARKAIFS